MTRQTCRLGDMGIGTCKIHSPPKLKGKVITCSPDVFINNRGSERLGDKVQATCKNIGKMITGSSTVFVNNRQISRIGDQFDGIYKGKMITGSPDVFAGG